MGCNEVKCDKTLMHIHEIHPSHQQSGPSRKNFNITLIVKQA